MNTTTPRTVSMLYFGRKPPKGWTEVSAMHLGRGYWMFRIVKVVKDEPMKREVNR